MQCAAARERFGPLIDDPRVRDVEVLQHLEGCNDCRRLLEGAREVRAILSQHPTLEPPAGLAERAALFAEQRRALLRQRARRVVWWPRLLRGAAAAVLVGTGLSLMLYPRAKASSVSETPLMTRAENVGVFLLERKDRLVEDLRTLQVIVTTAFQGRVEEVNDRVNDYRRLLERRRAAEKAGKKSEHFRTDPVRHS